MNTIQVVGNLTKDFEMRFGSNYCVANSGLAVNKRKFNRDTGQWEEGDTTFHNLSVWDEEYCTNVVESLGKGDRVMVIGEMKTRTYETESGEKRSAHEIRVTEIGPTLRWAIASPMKAAKKPAEKAAVPVEDAF